MNNIKINNFKKNNYMEVKFKAVSENEGFARACVANFCLPLDPTIDDLNDVKTAVSEAVTNCVVHAYPNHDGEVVIRAEIKDGILKISISDEGVGIADFKKAREPFYTSRPDEERSGMGFTIMESFMDSLELEKNGEKGVKVTLVKKIGKENALMEERC